MDLGRRIDVIWPNEQFRKSGGRLGWGKDWVPQEGMVGNVVHYWQPNHSDQYFRSNVNRTILLIKIGEKFVPISDKGVKEYNTIGLTTKIEETTPERSEDGTDNDNDEVSNDENPSVD